MSSSPIPHQLLLLILLAQVTVNSSPCNIHALLSQVPQPHVDVVQDAATGERMLIARHALRKGDIALAVPTSACINLGLAPAAVRWVVLCAVCAYIQVVVVVIDVLSRRYTTTKPGGRSAHCQGAGQGPQVPLGSIPGLLTTQRAQHRHHGRRDMAQYTMGAC